MLLIHAPVAIPMEISRFRVDGRCFSTTDPLPGLVCWAVIAVPPSGRCPTAAGAWA